jgi:mannose-6-phosphate isomerase
MLYPCKFEPILMERVWGGRRLARYGKQLPADKPIGESWEISDRDNAQSVVVNGSFRGRALRELVETLGQQLLGANLAGRPGPKRFPLLIKLLDARERLSLQVHPPARAAAKLGGEPKTEMWHILEADPDAGLLAGLRRGVTGADFIRALQRPPISAAPGHDEPSRPRTIEDCVHRVPVVAGDAFFVPSGRVHAIDAGLVLAEIQQNSDTTYRVCDWGRVGLDGKPRPLHIQESLACIDFKDFEPQKLKPRATFHGVNGLWRIVECEQFCVHRHDLRNACLEVCDGTTFHVIGCIEGNVGVLTADNSEEQLRPGEFALLPAAMGHYTLAPLDEPTTALKIFVPTPQQP